MYPQIWETFVKGSVAFSGGTQGEWRITTMSVLAGAPIAAAGALRIHDGSPGEVPADAQWTLRGFSSNMRYTTRRELDGLTQIQPPAGRPECTCAALIPIRKSAAWWSLAQDERRAIFEENSRHNAIGMQYLPGIARRLLHSRDLSEPFDFLTWFEFAPEAESSFDDLVAALRATQEWTYVDREIDIRLRKSGS